MFNYVVIAAILMASGVGAGAFGAHGLSAYFQGREEEIWKTAVFYQLIHALALLVLGLVLGLEPVKLKNLQLTCGLLFAGTFIFSGSLYLLVLCRQNWLGAITPIGGSLLILGWCILAASNLSGRN